MAGDESRDELSLNKGRHETATERLDRNWDELLQELRVTQTGVQLLSGFLLTLPFQQRFAEVPTRDQVAYLLAFALAITSTVLLVAPASAHRLLFRRGAKGPLVSLAHRLAQLGMLSLGLAVVAVVFLIFDVVVGTGPAVAASVVLVGVLLSTWIVLPLGAFGRRQTPPDGASG
ncbi:MAG: DUF6328 family protein [Dermatophilaceae bacterium]